MSNRVIRKLKGGDDMLIRKQFNSTDDNRLSESDTDSEKQLNSPSKSNRSKKLAGAVNRFELLNNLEHNSLSDTEAKEDDDRETEGRVSSRGTNADSVLAKTSLEKQDSTQSTDSMKRKKKKKRKLRSQRSLEMQLDSHHDEIEASIIEVNRILGEIPVCGNVEKVDKTKPHKKSVLVVESKHLNPENEMKRIFGSKAIQAEHSSSGRRKGRGRQNLARTWTLANPRNWQNIIKPGITMEHSGSVDNVNYFNFSHNRSYQAVQFLFLDAVESFSPDNLVSILNAHPYHIDTLIQFSDVCKIGEDNQMASELIERALFCFETIFHPLFNLTQANNRIDYKRSENRAFYIALFKHLMFVAQRGCNRTALEFCKLLLGLDPHNDPLAVLTFIDFYALRSENYDYLLDFYAEWGHTRKLNLFPNFCYSMALCYYFKSSNDAKESEMRNEANRLLQNALLLFPEFLLLLLEKCNVIPDSSVTGCTHFTAQNSPQAVKHMVALYVIRTHLMWKDRNIMQWLENNVKEAIERIQLKDAILKEFEDKRKAFFAKGTPRNILRHIILSGIKDNTLTMPADLSDTPIFGFDPLPPLDSTVSYRRPESSRPNAQVGDQSIFTLFLRSWLPNFENDMALRNVAAGQNDQRAPPLGAEGGGVQRREGEGNDLRRSVTSLLDAMRDLLSNIHMADIPNEGDVDSDDQSDQAEQNG